VPGRNESQIEEKKLEQEATSSSIGSHRGTPYVLEEVICRLFIVATQHRLDGDLA